MNADNFVDNNKFFNGFDQSRFDFMDSINWPTDESANLDALLLDHPLKGHSRLNSLNIPYRFSTNEKPQPVTPPQERDEFSDLISFTPEHDNSITSVH